MVVVIGPLQWGMSGSGPRALTCSCLSSATSSEPEKSIDLPVKCTSCATWTPFSCVWLNTDMHILTT